MKLMKKMMVFALALVLLLSAFPMQAHAAGATAGFPLPVSSTPYQVTVLERYSYGSDHTTYLYTYGPLKGRTEDLTIVMDIAAPGGTPIYAVADGKIITNTYANKSGYYVVIDHQNGTYSYYGHMQAQCSIKNGTWVSAGTQLGKVGKTGAADGNHLHFEWSGHDPYCEYKAKGYVTIKGNSGASKYPHNHPVPSTPPTNNTCSHSYTGGICKKCGYEYPYTITAMSPTAYKVTKSGGSPIWSRPYSNNSVRVNTMKKGSIVVAVGKTVNQAGNTWLLCSDGTWIYAGNVSKTSLSANTYYTYNTSGCLNVRSKPSTSGTILTAIPEGASVIVDTAKSKSGWLYVTYNGVSGYASKNYLTKTAPKISIFTCSGSVKITSKPGSGSNRGTIPAGAQFVVFTNRTSGSYYAVYYNNQIAGYIPKSGAKLVR